MLVDVAELGIPFSMNVLAVSDGYFRKSPKSVEAIGRLTSKESRRSRREKRKHEGVGEVYGQSGGTARCTTSLSLDISTLFRESIPSGGYGVRNGRPKAAPKGRLYDNSIVDRLVHEGFTDKLYKGGKP